MIMNTCMMAASMMSSITMIILYPLYAAYMVELTSAVVEWKQLSEDVEGNDSHPQRRRSMTFQYCEDIDMALVYGGYYDYVSTNGIGIPANQLVLSDAWLFSFAQNQWTKINPTSLESTSPSSRAEHASIVLPASATPLADENDKSCHVAIYGGYTIPGTNSNDRTFLNDLWVLSIYPGQNISSPWIYKFSKPRSDANPPPARAAHSMVAIGNDIYILGGYVLNNGISVVEDDLYKLNLIGTKSVNSTFYTFDATWERIRFSIDSFTPQFRSYAVVVSDQNSKAIVMYGGETGSNTMYSDAYVFDTLRSKWAKAVGFELTNTQSAGVMYHGYIIWYGGSYREVTQGTVRKYVYEDTSYSAITLVAVDRTSSEALSLECSDPVSKRKALWCYLIYDDKNSPGLRYSHAAIVRKDEMVIFGGTFRRSYSDMWSVGLPAIITSGSLYQSDASLNNIYIATTTVLFILIAMTVFIFAGRRRMIYQQYGQPNFRLRSEVIPGVPKNMIDALPLVPYKKGMKPDPVLLFSPEHLKEVEKAHQDDVEEGRNQDGGDSSKAQNDGENKEVGEEKRATATTKTGENGEEEEVCPICLGDLEEGESMKVLPCAHFFHPSCIDEWLVNHNSCPMCKRKVVKDVEVAVQSDQQPPQQQGQPLQLSASMSDILNHPAPQQQQQQQQQQQHQATEFNQLPQTTSNERRNVVIELRTTPGSPPQQASV